VNVRLETTGAAIQLVYSEQPKDLAVNSFAKSTGGGRVEVVHPDTFEGAFSVRFHLPSPPFSPFLTCPPIPLPRFRQPRLDLQINTNLTHTSTFSHPSSFPTATRQRSVKYDVEKRSEVRGTVEWEGSQGGVRSRSVVEAEGAVEIRVL
jgi:hypothetical protein